MKEQRQALRIRQALNHGLPDIPQGASRRLEAARHIALSRQKQETANFVMAGQGALRMARGSGNLPPVLRQLLPILALLLGMWISFYWHSQEYVSQIEEVDSALLTDDLPPEALIDRDFLEWLLDDTPED